MYRDYTFSRNDTMLVQRVDGTWERVGANFPCLTYKDDTYGKYRAGAWIPKALTNLFRDSEPATDPGQGSRNALSYSVCDWDFGLSSALDGMVIFGDNSVNRNYYNTPALATSTVYTMAFIIKPNDGLTPTFGGGASNIARVDIGNVPVGSGYVVESMGNGLFFVRVSATSFTVNTANTGIFKLTGNNAIGFEVSAIMCVLGTVTWDSWQDYLLDYIRTTGSSVARQVTDIRNTSFPLLASLQGFIDVEITLPGTGDQEIMNVGLGDSDKVQFLFLGDGRIFYRLLDGGSTIWSAAGNINYTSGRYRIPYFFSNGKNKLWVDNVQVLSNTGSYVPQGSNLVKGGRITGTTAKVVNGGFINEFCTSGISEAELLDKASFKTITQFANFKRAKFDDESLTTSAITLLQNTEL